MSHPTPILFLALAVLAGASAQAENFSGPHVEVVAGLSHDSREELDRKLKDDSLVYGAGGGYDVRLGSVVVGVLGEISGTTNKNCGEFDIMATPQTPSLSGRLCSRSQRSLFGGARLGYVAGENTLIYVLGGYENIRSKTSFAGTIGGADASRRGHATDSGFRVGGGLEQALTDHAFIKAEYRYAQTGDGPSRSERHQLVSGLGFRF